MGIGSFYNAKGVVVGQAMGLFAPQDTPLPADSIAAFDETIWASTVVTLGSPTAGTWTLTLSGGPFTVPVTITGVAFGVTGSALAAAVQAVLPVGYTAVVTGLGTTVSPFFIAVTGPGGARILITGNGTGLTGGTFSVIPPAWSATGATEQGWQANYNVSTNDINIEEQITPAGRNITSATYEFMANLSEDTVDSLQLAMASTKTVQAADTTHFGATQLNLSSDLPVYAVVLETKNRFKLPRRYYIPGATCAVNVGQTFARARGQRLVPVTFSSVCATESIVIREITANHT
jgi:hypothetical protein